MALFFVFCWACFLRAWRDASEAPPAAAYILRLRSYQHKLDDYGWLLLLLLLLLLVLLPPPTTTQMTQCRIHNDNNNSDNNNNDNNSNNNDDYGGYG